MEIGKNRNDKINEIILDFERECHRRKTGEFLEESGVSIPYPYIPPPPEPTDEWLVEFTKTLKEINETTCKIRKATRI